MCMGGSPPPPPPPLPAQAPLPPPAILETADGGSATTKAIQSNRGRRSLMIDSTQTATGLTGSGLSIPTT